MNAQSSKSYRERKGRIATQRSLGRATLDVTGNVSLRARAIQLPGHQLSQENDGSPDAQGVSEIWPSQEVRSGV